MARTKMVQVETKRPMSLGDARFVEPGTKVSMDYRVARELAATGKVTILDKDVAENPEVLNAEQPVVRRGKGA